MSYHVIIVGCEFKPVDLEFHRLLARTEQYHPAVVVIDDHRNPELTERQLLECAATKDFKINLEDVQEPKQRAPFYMSLPRYKKRKPR